MTPSSSSPRASPQDLAPAGRAQHSVPGQSPAQPRCSQGSVVWGCLHNSTAHRLQEMFWFCSRGKQKHIWKTLNFLHKTAFQPPCFLLSLPKRRQTRSRSQFSCSKAGGLGPLLQTSPFKHSFPLFLFHQQLLHRLCSSHIPRFYLPSANTSLIILCTSQVNDYYPHSLLPYICRRLQFGRIFRCLFEGCLKTLITTVSPSLR